ncbi:hypothetical protein CYMTET_29981 [Cymbomonas tetramitiformis]|uniref:Uncharacterized protein n=1 Tax=Cymbomonas tetramitiformis TaxID=36881 RepID=A0AAE0FJY2_9CHLO|nr:hypothetical protein CYMTET_29981 [Cymbomonas tetramitiformis]
MARSSSDNDSTSSSDSDTDSSTSSEVRRARRRDSVKKRKEKTKKDGKLKELKESRKRKKGHKLHHKEKDKKKSQKHKRHKKSKHSEPSENIQDTLGRTTDGVDAQGQSVLSSASRVSKQAEAVANDNASWKKQVMEAAAAAEERLTSGTYDAQLKEMDATHNAYGGGAVDWRARKRVKKERQAQKRMVDLGKQLIAKETAEMERMQSFLSAMGVPAGGLSEEQKKKKQEAELFIANQQQREAQRRFAKETAARKSKVQGPAFPPPLG